MISSPSELPLFRLAVQSSNYPPAKWVAETADVGDEVKVRVGGEYWWSAYHAASTAITVDKSIGPSRSCAQKLLLIAGGIGITPFTAMLKDLETSLESKTLGSKELRVALLYSARSLNDLIFHDWIEQLQLRFPNQLSFQTNLTREESNAIALDHRKGRLTEHDIQQKLQFLRADSTHDHDIDVFVCGPPKFSDSMEVLARNVGLSPQIERWW